MGNGASERLLLCDICTCACACTCTHADANADAHADAANADATASGEQPNTAEWARGSARNRILDCSSRA